jgi:site-specific DNA-cytosine methylase
MPDTILSTPRLGQQRLTVFSFCCGLGGQTRGFQKAAIRLGAISARWHCIGGIDSDPAGLRDFERLTGAKGTLLDLFDRDQYEQFHGHPPPPGWREVTADDIRAAAGYEVPDCVTISAPCKGLSGLLSSKVAATMKYQALNRLTVRCIMLMREAWGDDAPSIVLFENVPRIYTRGRHLVDQILAIFADWGFAARETTHCCGRLGGLAQGRKRALIVARNTAKVPAFLYEPPQQRLRGVGEVIGLLPLPGDPIAGPLHRVPQLAWETWVRLAFVPAGKDWRALNGLRVVDGKLQDWALAPVEDWHAGVLGVKDWQDTACTVTGRASPTTGSYSVADPRPGFTHTYNQLGIGTWDSPAATVTGQKAPGQGRFSVADPRPGYDGAAKNVFRVVPFDHPAGTVTAGHGPSSGGGCVADPRPPAGSHGKWAVTPLDAPTRTVISGSTTGQGASAVADLRYPWGSNAHINKMAVRDWHAPAGTVTGSDRVGSGAMSVADPMPAFLRGQERRDSYQTGGHYGVQGWTDPSLSISAHPKNNNGPWSVADPRTMFAVPTDPASNPPLATLPGPKDRGVFLIIAADGTWHRPFTTLDLAALQSLLDVEAYAGSLDRWRRACRQASRDGTPLPSPPEPWDLDGISDSAKRERIGNAIPPDSAEAIAVEVGRTLLLSRLERTTPIAKTPIWVRPITTALTLPATEKLT